MTDDELREHLARLAETTAHGFAELAGAQARTEAQVARVGENVSALTAVLLTRLVPANERVALAVEALTRRIDALIQRRGNGGAPGETT